MDLLEHVDEKKDVLLLCFGLVLKGSIGNLYHLTLAF